MKSAIYLQTMVSMIYLQAIVSSKDEDNIGTAIVIDPDTGLSCRYNFCTNYTPGGEPADYVTHQLLIVDDLGDDLSNPKRLPILANISSKALKSILEYMEVDGANNISKNVVFSEEYGIMWRAGIQVKSDKYSGIKPGGRAAIAKEKTENRLIEAAKHNNSEGHTKPKRLKGYNIQIDKPHDFVPRDTIASDKYDRDTVFNARYAALENVQKLRKSMDKAKHSSESIFAYNASGEPVAFKITPAYDPFTVPAGFRADVNSFNIPEQSREYLPEIAYKEALIPDFQSIYVRPIDIDDYDDKVHTRYYAFVNNIPWDECRILHSIVLKTVKADSNGIHTENEELVIDTSTLIKILKSITIGKGVPDNRVPPVTINSLYGPMWLHGKTCFVDDKSRADNIKRAAEAFSNRYDDITKYYEVGTLAENNNKALEAAMQIRRWMVDPPKSCDEYSVSERLFDNFERELIPLHCAKHTEIFTKDLGKSGIKKILGYTANKRIMEFGRLKAAEKAAEQVANATTENQASGTPEKGTAIVRYINNDGATTKYEIQFEDLSLETLTIRDLAKNIITGKMKIDNIEIKEANGRKKLVCTSSDIETVNNE